VVDVQDEVVPSHDADSLGEVEGVVLKQVNGKVLHFHIVDKFDRKSD
jgi:hypothetical protein